MKIKVLVILGLIYITLTTGCNQSNVSDPFEQQGNQNLKMIVDHSEYQKLDLLRKSGGGVSDPFTIEKVDVVKDSLAITVSYLGAVSYWGTKLQHKFTLCWAGDVTIMIYPMPANLILTHDANGHSGKTKYVETLMFSLKDLGINDPKDYVFNVYSIFNSTDVPDSSSKN